MKKAIKKIRDHYEENGIMYGFVFPLLIIFVIIGFIVGAGKDAKNKNEYVTNGTHTTIFVDGETGVNYILYSGAKETSITVRYNADGTIYVSEKENN